MQTINIVTLLREFMNTVASNTAVSTFEKYFLGYGILSSDSYVYSKDEYFDLLNKVLKFNGEGFEYNAMLYTRRYDSKGELEGNTFFVTTSTKKKHIKENFDFNTFLINPAFVFIIFPKMNDYAQQKYNQEMEIVSSISDLVIEWKNFLYPIIKDFCTLKDRFIPIKNRIIYHNKTYIVAANRIQQVISWHKLDNNSMTFYKNNPYSPSDVIKSIINYD